MSSPIRVLVVDDDALVRAGLSMMLAGTDDIRIVAEAADGSEVGPAVDAYRPDVVLMDIRMPVLDGIEATRRIVAAQPGCRVLILTTFGLDARRARAQELLARLTDREREVAVAIGQGKSNAEIGGELYMSVATVKAHVSRLLAKLELNNRVQIALLAHDAGLA